MSAWLEEIEERVQFEAELLATLERIALALERIATTVEHIDDKKLVR